LAKTRGNGYVFSDTLLEKKNSIDDAVSVIWCYVTEINLFPNPVLVLAGFQFLNLARSSSDQI